MDLYGSQLCNYGTGYPETFYFAWRKVTRLIWNLPFRTHCNLHTINICYSINNKLLYWHISKKHIDSTTVKHK